MLGWMRQEMEQKINIFNWQYSFEHRKVSMLIEKLADLLGAAHDIYKKLDFLNCLSSEVIPC